jgi:mono/diheme cytochrome c family protein
VTEVPEHLLKRSRDRRGALGLGGGDGGDGGDATPAAAAPADEPGPGSAVAPAAATAAAKQAAAVPAEAAEPAKPVPPYVQAALKRKKIPLWVMPVLIFIPVWAVIYVGGLSKAASGAPTQLQAGATIFAASCAGCHGSTGGGGVGRPMTDSALIKTFPDIVGQLQFVWTGSDGAGPAGTVYGDPKREGGPHSVQSFNGNKMPNFDGTLTQTQLLEVIRYERETLSGVAADPKQVDAAGNMLWPNGKPMLDTAGKLITPDGQPLFDADNKLTIQPNWTAPVGGTG